MNTVIFSESKFMTVSTIPKNITDDFMDKILEYGHDNLSWHALIHAQIKFNSRANNQNQIWYPEAQVFFRFVLLLLYGMVIKLKQEY